MPLSPSVDTVAIRVTVPGPPVKVGSTASVVIEFLDRNFRLVRNARNRTVRLDVLNR
jgi:hypothetical protein